MQSRESRSNERPLSGVEIALTTVANWPKAVFRGSSSSEIVCPIKCRLIQLNPSHSIWPSQGTTRDFLAQSILSLRQY
jgi:hypothetical protein